MDWTAPIDIYCERTAAGLVAEPLNAISNAAFLVAGAWGFGHARQAEEQDVAALVLAGLVITIGIGSLLFHTFADRWSAIADVLPISLFIYGYLGLVLHRFFRFGAATTLAALALFLVLSLVAERLLSPMIAGSAAYVPALLALLSIGALLKWTDHGAWRALVGGGCVFLVSLTFRTLDEPLCGVWPAGTHFVWHLLNAATLAILLGAAARHGSDPVGNVANT